MLHRDAGRCQGTPNAATDTTVTAGGVYTGCSSGWGRWAVKRGRSSPRRDETGRRPPSGQVQPSLVGGGRSAGRRGADPAHFSSGCTKDPAAVCSGRSTSNMRAAPGAPELGVSASTNHFRRRERLTPAGAVIRPSEVWPTMGTTDWPDRPPRAPAGIPPLVSTALTPTSVPSAR